MAHTRLPETVVRGATCLGQLHPSATSPFGPAGRAATRRPNAPWGSRAWQEGKNGSIWSLRNIPRLRGAQGSALLIVVVLLGTVAALVAVVSRSVSSAAMEAAVLLDEGRAESALRSGIDVGVAGILKLGLHERVAEADVDLIDSRLFVRASNESARIDLNKSPRPLLAGLIRESGVDPGAADALAERILDWRAGPGAQQASDRTVPPHLVQLTIPLPGPQRVEPYPQRASLFTRCSSLRSMVSPTLWSRAWCPS